MFDEVTKDQDFAKLTGGLDKGEGLDNFENGSTLNTLNKYLQFKYWEKMLNHEDFSKKKYSS